MTNKTKKSEKLSDEQICKILHISKRNIRSTTSGADAPKRNDPLQRLRQENPPLHRPEKRPRRIYQRQHRAPRKVFHSRHFYLKQPRQT